MSNATHINIVSGNHYLLKDGVVFQWHKTWVTSAFKEVDIIEENGFKKI